MHRLERPPTVGLVAAALTVVLVLVPYALPGLDASGVEQYYDYGFLGGWSVLIVALVAVVVFASGRQRRSDPATAAGAGLVLGLAATVLAATWVLQLPYEVVVQFETTALFEYHRWLVLLASLATAAAGAWYAWELDLV